MHLHDMEQWLRQHGYELRRITGSHRHYYTGNGKQRITITAHGGRRTFPAPHVAMIQADLERNARQQGGAR